MTTDKDVSIIPMGGHAYRVHIPGEINSRLVEFTTRGSVCDGQDCEKGCRHILAAEPAEFTADEMLVRKVFGIH